MFAVLMMIDYGNIYSCLFKDDSQKQPGPQKKFFKKLTFFDIRACEFVNKQQLPKVSHPSQVIKS